MDTNYTGNTSFQLVLSRFHYDYPSIKWPILIFSMVLLCLCFISLGIIIYLESSSIKNLSSKKNLINYVSESIETLIDFFLFEHLPKMIPSFCLILIAWMIILFVPRWLHFALSLKNLPSPYCTLQSIMGSIFVVHYLLMLDAIVVTKYILIFVLKNPLELDDALWNIIINVAIWSFSISSQIFFTFFQSGEFHK